MDTSVRRLAGAAVLLLLVASVPAVAAPAAPRDTTAACAEAEPVVLEDVAGRYAADVGCLLGLGLAVGVTPSTFAPDAPLTRGQASSMLLRALIAQRIDPVLTDTCGGVHATATSVFVDTGVLDTCDGAPALTRSELAQLVVAVLDGFVGVALDASTDRWPDDDALPPAVQRAHDVLGAAGVVAGVPVDAGVELRPDVPVTRKEAALVVLRTHGWLLDELGPPGG